MGENEIKADIRLWALEVLVCNMFVMMLALDQSPSEIYEKIRKQMIEGAQKKTFPGFDAALSDHVAGELEAAVERLMDLAKTQMAVGSKGR